MKLIYKKTSDDRGFTLIEAIAVLIILGIIAAVVVSRGMSTQNDLIPQSDTVKTHLRFSQLKALADEDYTSVSWGISFSGASYTLTRNGNPASINLPGENNNSHTFPTGVTVANAAVNFDTWGSPGTTLVTVTLTQGGVSQPITITPQTGYIP